MENGFSIAMTPVQLAAVMKKYETLAVFLTTFMGADADAYGNSYSEIVDASTHLLPGLVDDLVTEVSIYIEEHPDNESAASTLNEITRLESGYLSYLYPSAIEFLHWLLGYLKQKRDEHNAR
ncbi:hypothetical protein [Erwinia sp. JH02]|uniref:hypothetical protein n=1 Tax=Erwinia sp. JH02 TaxID=2733394 RepID=UPI001487C863|nr:hypothetical protein [Erwinia sp. JH02]NNS07719.1 hypothetical protein [Erwinia sp. JH02]